MIPSANSSSTKKPRYLAGIIAAFFWGLVGAMFSGAVVFLPVEQASLALRDFILRALPAASPHPGLMFVSLDEGSFNLTHLEPSEIEGSPALQAMEGDFPWSRAVYAEMIERLLSAGAECVILDIHFPQAGRGDDALAKVVADNPGRVIFGAVLDLREEVDGSLNVVYSPPTPSIGASQGGAEGFVNFWPDRDGVVRTADYETTLSRAKGSESLPGERVFYSLAAVAMQKIAPDVPLPPSPSLLRFVRPGSFPTIPLWQLFVPAFWENNLKNGAVFSGKIIVFGATAARFRDDFRTPMIADMPGAELHLNALSAALQGDFFADPPRWVSAALCFLVSFTALLPFRRNVRPLAALLGFLFLFLGAMFLLWFVAVRANILLPPAPILGAMAASGATAFGMRLLAEVRERLRVRRVLERYVSRQIVHEVLDHPASLLDELGGTRKDVTVLFSDLRGFTTLTESADPAALVVQLNEYLGSMVELIFENGGTIDKFMGDAVMAVWGSVGSQGEQADTRAAFAAASAMPAKLSELNAEWKKSGKPELRLGIGLHAGGAIFGNIGSPQKMELTVIGDTVNLASRLESACKFYGVPFVFSSAVRERLDPQERVLPLDLLRVRGRREPVEIFTTQACISPGHLSPGLPDVFCDAVDAYRRADFPRCLALLESLPPASREFPPVTVYMERCVSLLGTTLPADWSPVTEADGK
jgi:adenylate cyclase